MRPTCTRACRFASISPKDGSVYGAQGNQWTASVLRRRSSILGPEEHSIRVRNDRVKESFDRRRPAQRAAIDIEHVCNPVVATECQPAVEGDGRKLSHQIRTPRKRKVPDCRARASVRSDDSIVINDVKISVRVDNRPSLNARTFWRSPENCIRRRPDGAC